MSAKPVLYGAPYSVYTRVARLALAEKGVAYAFETVDIFGSETPPPAGYATINPFGKIPSLRHGDLLLYETQAIVRYLDAAFPGPALSPAAPRDRARMDQLIGIADSYAYPHLVWGIMVAEREAGALAPGAEDKAAACLAVLADLLGEPYALGPELSLADLHLAPMLTYLRLVPSGRRLLGAHPALGAWLDRLAARPSLQATRYPAEETG
jgi:glutathione S-transferase